MSGNPSSDVFPDHPMRPSTTNGGNMSVTFVMSSKASVVVRVYAVAVWDVAVRVTRSRAPNMRS
ncbi:MAG: hypothetical protein DMF86_11210, partial [Acidobacteria bacterium]